MVIEPAARPVKAGDAAGAGPLAPADAAAAPVVAAAAAAAVGFVAPLAEPGAAADACGGGSPGKAVVRGGRGGWGGREG
jgi:hypothetical protein